MNALLYYISFGPCFCLHRLFVNNYKPITFFVKRLFYKNVILVNPDIVIQLFSLRKALKLQPRLSSPDGSQALVSVDSHASSSPPGLVDTVGNAEVDNHSLLLGQSQNPGTDTCLTQDNSTSSSTGHLPESVPNPVAEDQLLEGEDVEDAGNPEGSVNRTLLGDVQTVPIQIIDSRPVLGK